jgi:hypothetical protein
MEKVNFHTITQISGKETWVDGSSFEGEYAQGKKHGLGHYIWSDGASYEGYWSQNKIHGKVISK